MASGGRVTPSDLLLANDELVVLIHGYNNAESVAFDSYKCFSDNVGNAWARHISGVFWPGDGVTLRAGSGAGWHTPAIAMLSYPSQPQRAIEAAERLQEVVSAACAARAAIAARSGNQARHLVLNVVAHSMGSRVALEFIRLIRSALAAGVRIRLRTLTLMAAAVPRYMIEARGDLERAFSTAERTLVFWSREDYVLRFVFPLGQALERPFPLGWKIGSRKAVGHAGVSESDSVVSVETSIGHRDYWSSREVAERVRDELNGEEEIPSIRRLRSRMPFRRKLGQRSL